ncbi:unnamed protein product [Acanthoscelides obtectus]|uniref:Uncharacterized protein n=1 Tax=Acanthoscelides obtectus TaxID=200917 RepID=A0A9P0LA81_ACAOB|nr:unnamed protein product [Acanthoscelides obtectus]CAK1663131.1 hypothetical protein AOBTE_LOCUS23495 [Acanthoscelides obtectus]
MHIFIDRRVLPIPWVGDPTKSFRNWTWSAQRMGGSSPGGRHGRSSRRASTPNQCKVTSNAQSSKHSKKTQQNQNIKRKNWRGLHRPFLFFCGGFRPDTVRIPGIFNFDKLLQPRIKDLQEENQWGR